MRISENHYWQRELCQKQRLLGQYRRGNMDLGNHYHQRLDFYRLKLVLETDIWEMILDKHNFMSAFLKDTPFIKSFWGIVWPNDLGNGNPFVFIILHALNLKWPCKKSHDSHPLRQWWHKSLKWLQTFRHHLQTYFHRHLRMLFLLHQ